MTGITAIINADCPHCGEEITLEPLRRIGEYYYHRECAIRMVAGSAAHQLGECSCFGGTREDPPDMTVRQAAQLAYDTFQWLHDPHGAEIQEQLRGASR